MKRRDFIKSTAVTSGMISTLPSFAFNADSESNAGFPVIDLHVHLTETFTIDKVLEISKKYNVTFGIVDHPASWALKDDNDLRNFIEKLRNYPVYIGLQPTYLGWRKNYSEELISQLDYILMDPQMVPKGNGEIWQIWEFDTYIEDTEDFMKRYMDYALEVLNSEPIDIFGWPLFLPVCIARDYYDLWTEERMQQILTAAKQNNIAIEINDMAHTPHEDFILKAKAEGLKFTFGSDSRNMIAGKLAYCKRVAEKCNLNKNDFFIPARRLSESIKITGS